MMRYAADALASEYRGRQVLITGGLGFIGSNLAVRLAGLGARVRIIDSLQPGCGGAHHNLTPCRSSIELEVADIGETDRASAALEGVDTVFNLAGEISHAGSMRDPANDLRLNVISQLAFLQCCARVRPGARVVYTSTRQVYGRTNGRPVTESHPVEPVDFNGVHKHTATQYHLLLGNTGAIDPFILRLTNVYGPRMALPIPGHGFLAVFFRKALNGEPICVFGDGRQRRDPVYVGDVVEALLASGLVQAPEHRIVNIGHRASVPVLKIARAISRAAGLPAPSLRPWPDEEKAVDIGDFSTSGERALSVLGWAPQTSLEDGIRATLEFYGQTAAGFSPAPEPAWLGLTHG